ncbi:MAG: hypothetical protein ACREKI_09640, partial [Gemmatimonadota bacterium]
MRHRLPLVAVSLAVLPVAAAARQVPETARDRPAEPRLEITVDSARHALVVSVGPLDLPAGISHHALPQMPVLTGTIPVSVNLYGFRIDLVDGAGGPVPARVLHHVNLIDPDHRELFLPISRRLFAAGEETGDQTMPGWLLGVPLEEGQRLIVSTMFHNPTDAPYEDVVLRIALLYKPQESVWPILQVYPFQMDVMFPVGDKSFDLPPGRSQRSYEARPAVAGRILAMGGHMHDLGTALRFEDATTGEVLWETKPVTDEEGELLAIPVGQFWRRLGIPITPEHTYRVTVLYDNPTGDTIAQGAMGVVGGVFLPKDPKAWPKPDADDPLYTADLRHALRLDGGHGDHGDGGHRMPQKEGAAKSEQG